MPHSLTPHCRLCESIAGSKRGKWPRAERGCSRVALVVKDVASPLRQSLRERLPIKAMPANACAEECSGPVLGAAVVLSGAHLAGEPEPAEDRRRAYVRQQQPLAGRKSHQLVILQSRGGDGPHASEYFHDARDLACSEVACSAARRSLSQVEAPIAAGREEQRQPFRSVRITYPGDAMQGCMPASRWEVRQFRQWRRRRDTHAIRAKAARRAASSSGSIERSARIQSTGRCPWSSSWSVENHEITSQASPIPASRNTRRTRLTAG